MEEREGERWKRENGLFEKYKEGGSTKSKEKRELGVGA